MSRNESWSNEIEERKTRKTQKVYHIEEIIISTVLLDWNWISVEAQCSQFYWMALCLHFSIDFSTISSISIEYLCYHHQIKIKLESIPKFKYIHNDFPLWILFDCKFISKNFQEFFQLKVYAIFNLIRSYHPYADNAINKSKNFISF